MSHKAHFTLFFDDQGDLEAAVDTNGVRHERGKGGEDNHSGTNPTPVPILIMRTDTHSPGCYWIRLGNRWYCLPTDDQ